MIRFFLAIIIIIFQSYTLADVVKKGDVVMIANGDYDVFINTTEEELAPIVKELGIPIGGTQVVELDYLNNLISRFKPIKTSFGGSAANTAYILSRLGKNNGIYVLLSDEKISKGFIRNLEKAGVKNYGAYISKKDRGNHSVMTKVAVFISGSKATNQSERTFVAYKGLSGDFSKIKFDLSHIKNYKILYIEGYAFSAKSKDVIFDAINEAKKHNVKVLFAPSSPFFVKAYKEDFEKIIDLSDIVFTNNNELSTLYEDKDIEISIKKLAKRAELTIVTNGKHGATVSYDRGKHAFLVYPNMDQSKVIDTTGAGDSYLAGFLYGYLNGYDIEKCGVIGTKVANHIIQEISARPSKQMLHKIKEEVKRYASK
ncbi:MAG: Sugar kinase, ribokinase family [Pseudomonadota bacterium]